MDTVSIARLTAWLATFETLLLERGDSKGLGQGMTAVLGTMASRPADDSVGECFTAVGMTLVGAAGQASGPLYATFFLRFGMDAGPASALDAASLGRALRAGYEGAVARGTGAMGGTSVLDVLSRGVEAYDVEIARGADAATAASTASHAARGTGDQVDPDAASAVLLLEALATALRAG